MKCEEGAIVLIGFDDDGIATAPAQVATPPLHAPADDASRGCRRPGERVRRHDRGGRLAVRTGDANDGHAVHRGAECFCAANDRQTGGGRGSELDMIHRDGGRADHRSRATHPCGVMPAVHRDSEGLEIRMPCRIHVAAGDGDAAAHEEFCQCTHASAGNPDEVHRSRVGIAEQVQCINPHSCARAGINGHAKSLQST